MGLSRPTVHRIAQALADEKLITQPAGSRHYVVSLDFFTLAVSATDGQGLREACRPSLLRLSASTGDTLFLLARNAYEAVCIDRVEGKYPIRAVTKGVGETLPLGLVPGGLVMLAFLPPSEQDEILRVNLPQLLNEMYPDEIALRMGLRETREVGYAVSRGLLIKGVGGLAVPLLDRRGQAVGALSIGGVAERFTPQRINAVLPVLRQEVAGIEKLLNPLSTLSEATA
jgi:DNA-binding IclR family transcriptional regulator